MRQSMLRGVVVLRWTSWIWLAIVALLTRHEMRRPAVALLVVTATLVSTMVAHTLSARPAPGPRVALALCEGAIAIGVNMAGGLVYRSEPFAASHTFGSLWPLGSIMTLGILFGRRAGTIAGVVIGGARFFQPIAMGVAVRDFGRPQVIGLWGTTIVSAIVGLVAAHVARLVVTAEREVTQARAREHVARQLHDGVLQTLAVIERRADDPQLARMAREQELELREFLFGGGSTADRGGAKELGPLVRSAAARFESAFGGHVECVLAPDLPPLTPTKVEALAGAVGEALMNAGKHGAAKRVTVYAEPDELSMTNGGGSSRGAGVMCSVRDDGSGFEPSQIREGVGLSRSIKGRIEEIGGRVEIDSRPGGGTEVRLWVW